MDKGKLKELAIEDLTRSGLNESDFKKMGLILCNEDEASVILNSSFCTYGYALPYFDVNGKMIDSIRFKFLDDLKNEKGKVVKYSQPKGTEPRLYFPSCIKWKKILKDSSITITFTEGEKKAYKASKEGIPTIGLGGVWSFKSKRLQKNLIDDFKDIVFKDRKVQICFDNDARSNDDVMKAQRAFAKELNEEGAKVCSKPLPFNPYVKIGLDDYLVTHSKEDFDDLEEEFFEDITEVNNLNDEIAYIKELGKVYIFKDNLFTSDKPLVNLIYANRTTSGENGPVCVAARWLGWSGRRTHTRLTYKPGQPRVTDENEYNLWKGWGCEPKKGSVAPFMNALSQVLNNDKELITWMLDWIAYPIQNPGAKMYAAVLFQSVGQGTGKSSIGLCIGSMYGDNYQLIDDEQLHGAFNEWAINKQFVLGDEVSGKDKRSDTDKVKNIITRPQVTINKKYSPTYTIPDCINYFFTSNHVDALNIEEDDRRIFVHRIKQENYLTLEQGRKLERYHKFLTHNCHLLHYFAYEHKISKHFDSQERPPMTEDKAILIDHSLTDIERFLVSIRDDPEHTLVIDNVPIDRDLFTTSQIAQLYQRKHQNRNISLTAVGKAIQKIFSDSVNVAVLTTNGTQRLKALRNFDKWKKASHKEMQEHYDKSKIAMFEAKKSKMKKEG